MGNLTDWQAMRCGHNYEPDACRADYCGFRDAVNELKRLRVENGRLRVALENIARPDEYWMMTLHVIPPGADELRIMARTALAAPKEHTNG